MIHPRIPLSARDVLSTNLASAFPDTKNQAIPALTRVDSLAYPAPGPGIVHLCERGVCRDAADERHGDHKAPCFPDEISKVLRALHDAAPALSPGQICVV